MLGGSLEWLRLTGERGGGIHYMHLAHLGGHMEPPVLRFTQ